MTITKTLKTKLVLGILAAAVSLSLAMGGTLMLFTAQSEEATNVVTLGNAAISLQESDDPLFDEEGDAITPTYTAANNGNLLEFDNVQPGDTLYKRPQVTNTGSVPVFVYVEGILTVLDADNGEVDLSGVTISEEGDISGGSEVAQQVYSILNSVNAEALSSDWKGTPIDTTVASTGILTGAWYYADDVDVLKVLGTIDEAVDGSGVTSDIFTTIEVPTSVDNALAKYSISLKLKAYAVQSDNNAGMSLADFQALFAEDAE
jgi:predicted ribosomally synthesized peptide with SipW-like signal peptide